MDNSLLINIEGKSVYVFWGPLKCEGYHRIHVLGGILLMLHVSVGDPVIFVFLVQIGESFLCQDRPILLQTLNNSASDRQCLNLGPRAWVGAAARELSWVEAARGWQVTNPCEIAITSCVNFAGIRQRLSWQPQGLSDSASFCLVAPSPALKRLHRGGSWSGTMAAGHVGADKWSESQDSESRDPREPADGKEL